MRYHSLVIEPDSLSEDLISIAWTASPKMLSFLESDKPDITSSTLWGSLDNLFVTNQSECSTTGGKMPSINDASELDGYRVLMGVRHSTRPHYGVQVYCLYLCNVFYFFFSLFLYLITVKFSFTPRVLLLIMEDRYFKTSRR